MGIWTVSAVDGEATHVFVRHRRLQCDESRLHGGSGTRSGDDLQHDENAHRRPLAVEREEAEPEETEDPADLQLLGQMQQRWSDARSGGTFESCSA